MLAGFDHVAVLTCDLQGFVRFYEDVFGAEVEGGLSEDGLEMVVLRIGPTSEINVFQIDGNFGAVAGLTEVQAKQGPRMPSAPRVGNDGFRVGLAFLLAIAAPFLGIAAAAFFLPRNIRRKLKMIGRA